MSRLGDALVGAGMRVMEAEAKEALFAKAARALGVESPEDPGLRAWWVPGRVEVLGKHTDYAGGRSLVGAVERGFCFLARPRPDAALEIIDAESGARERLALDPGLEVPEGRWTGYPATVVKRLTRDFGLSAGIELAFASDLPAAAGLSSGSALTIGVFLALADANRLEDHPRYRSACSGPDDLAEYLGSVENGRRFGPFEAAAGVGTLGGCEDQAAILGAIPGALAQYSFVPVRLERRVPFPDGHCLVIGSSGVVAEKSGGARGAYNAAAAAAAAIHRRWIEITGREDPSLGAALAGSPGARERLAAMLADDPALLARLEQFVAESEEIIPAAGDALARGDLERFGELVDRSQAGAERGLGNQIPETIHLQRSARGLGAVAASAFGAGFGGSVWAMVPTDEAEAFRETWARDYGAAFPHRAAGARFFTTLPGPAALRLELAP